MNPTCIGVINECNKQGHGAQGDGEAVGRPAGGAEARGGAGGGAAGLARGAAGHRAAGILPVWFFLTFGAFVLFWKEVHYHRLYFVHSANQSKTKKPVKCESDSYTIGSVPSYKI